MPTVSVVIPTYNRKDQLVQSLESVFVQSYREYEVLVIDDGSTDGTNEAMESLRGSVRYIYQENSGQASARNRGIRLAQGELIAFLDSDDIWDPMHLEIGVRVLKRYPEVVLVSAGPVGFREGVKDVLDDQEVFCGDLFLKLFEHCFIRTPATMVRKWCLEKSGGFNEAYRCFEDYDLWLRIARQHHIAYVNRPLVEIRRQGDNLSKDPTLAREVILEILDKNYDPSRVPVSTYRSRVSNCCLGVGRSLLARGERERAWSYFWRAQALTPYSSRPYRYMVKSIFRKLMPTK